jgi:hypothetical protein
VEAELLRLTACLKDLWAVPWDNWTKETLWRLIVNGVGGAGGHGIVCAGPCPCGWSVLDSPRQWAAGRLRSRLAAGHGRGGDSGVAAAAGPRAADAPAAGEDQPARPEGGGAGWC